MPKLNSIELKHKRKILNWAGENWGKLSETSKVKIWCALLSKEMPTKIAGDENEEPIRIIYRAYTDSAKPEAR